MRAAPVGVVLLAAGASRRLPGEVRKPYRCLAGRPLLARSLRTLASLPEVRQIVLVTRSEDRARALRIARTCVAPSAPAGPSLSAVRGGRERADSVARGLAALAPEIGWVAIHDSARPFVSRRLVRSVVAAARRFGGAIPALPAGDTLKRVRGGRVTGTVPREGLWMAQTPQVFRRAWLEKAFDRRGGRAWTDDACAFEAAGRAVAVVPGDPTNFKITTKGDLRRARIFLGIR